MTVAKKNTLKKLSKIAGVDKEFFANLRPSKELEKAQGVEC